MLAALPSLSGHSKAHSSKHDKDGHPVKACRLLAERDHAARSARSPESISFCRDLIYHFDFGSSEVGEALVRQLYAGEFMAGAHNVVLISGSGTGKTHIAVDRRAIRTPFPG